MSLLKKAKEFDKDGRSQVTISEEHVELAIAYIKGDITIKAVSQALEVRAGGASAYITLCRALKEAYSQDKIKTS